MLWSGYLFRRWVLGVIGLRPDYNKRLIIRQVKRCGVDLKHIELRRYFHIGIRNVPEFLLAPRELDFPRALRPNQEICTPPSTLSRSEGSGDWTFERRFEQMVQQRPHVPLLYCSLGTAGWRYVGGTRFLQNVVRAADGQPWNLILSIAEMDRHRLGILPENVAVFTSVPQLKVLRSCDLMITHGGMNSIKECFHCKVPMLVYPGSNAIDQAGNAARVVYHGLGLMGDIRGETREGVQKKIWRILYDECLSKLAAKQTAFQGSSHEGLATPELTGARELAVTASPVCEFKSFDIFKRLEDKNDFRRNHLYRLTGGVPR